VRRDDSSPRTRHPPGTSAIALALFVVASLVVACGHDGEDGDDRLVVTVSIVPQAYFVAEVGRSLVSVNVMVEPGANPATYEPNASQMRALSESDAYVGIGVPFEEAWLDRISAANPDMVLVDSTTGVDLRTFHGGVVDPHIWLSPGRAAIQAQTIAQALMELDPDHEAEYLANLERFQEEVEGLDVRIAEMLEPYHGAVFVVSHPSWAYFAEDYSLEMIPIEVGGQEPSAAELRDLVKLAQREGVRVIFAQPQFSTEAAEIVADEIGGEVLLIDPLAEDWAANLQDVAETMAGVLGNGLS
jgi:zinc transport system substrate-binding protein